MKNADTEEKEVENNSEREDSYLDETIAELEDDYAEGNYIEQPKNVNRVVNKLVGWGG